MDVSCQRHSCHRLPPPLEDLPCARIVVVEDLIFEELHLRASDRRYFGEHPFPTAFGANQNVAIRHRHNAKPIDDESEFRAIGAAGIVSKLINQVQSRWIDFVHLAFHLSVLKFVRPALLVFVVFCHSPIAVKATGDHEGVSGPERFGVACFVNDRKGAFEDETALVVGVISHALGTG